MATQQRNQLAEVYAGRYPEAEAPVAHAAYLSGYDQSTKDAVSAIMDLVGALRNIDGEPTLKDLVKLAQRLRK